MLKRKHKYQRTLDEFALSADFVEEHDVDDNSKGSEVRNSAQSLRNFIAENNVKVPDDIFKNVEIRKQLDVIGGVEFDNTDYAPLLLSRLLEKKLISSYDGSTSLADVSQDSLLKLADNQLIIKLDDETGLIYVEIEEDGHVTKKFLELSDVDNTFRSVLVDNLPAITFDTAGNGGVLAKAVEQKSIYKLLSLNLIFHGIYNNRINNVLQQYGEGSYDFTLLDENKYNFSDLLRLVVEDAPPIVNVILKACNQKISAQNLKKDSLFQDRISIKENQALAALQLEVNQTELKFDRIINSKETKAEREVERNNMRKEIVYVLSKHPGASVVYMIKKLTTASINAKDYILLTEAANEFANAIRIKESITDVQQFAKLKRQVKRRALREYLSEFKLKLLNLHLEGEDVSSLL